MILGISGKMRTGKNRASDYIAREYGFGQTAFADPIKEIGIKYFGLKPEECYDQKTPYSRKVLQEVGKSFRDIDQDVWCRRCLTQIPEGQSMIISDVRFPNEVAMIRQYGGKIIRLVRETGDQPGKDHISETALDEYIEFDEVIENNGPLEKLYQDLDRCLEAWGARRLHLTADE